MSKHLKRSWARVSCCALVWQIVGMGAVSLGAATPDPLTGHYYEFVTSLQTWDEARVDANTMFIGGARGHLATVFNREENDIVRFLGNAAEKWIGLTDSTQVSTIDGFDFRLLGTIEAGNTSDLPLPAPGVSPVLGERGAGFRWITGEPLTFMNWRAGTPGDMFGQADAVYSLTQGVWQDTPSGSSLGQPGIGQPALRTSVVEWDMELMQNRLRVVERVAGDGFRNGSGLVVTLADADLLMSLPAEHADVARQQTADAYVISFHDPELPGGFSDYVRHPYLTNVVGTNDDHFVQRAMGQLIIPTAGEWTFAVMSGDSYRLRVGGNQYVDAGTLPQGPASLTITEGSGTLTPTVGGGGTTFYFPEAGVYGLDLTAIESDSFAFIQLFAAAGIHTTFDAASFALVGDVINGGLAVAANRNPDFNHDGSMDCGDINALTMAIVAQSVDPIFDLNYDGNVDPRDLEIWLSDAASVNLVPNPPYATGDANLDGMVNSADFEILRDNLFSLQSRWCQGDFNVDGFVDGHDFDLWNANKSTSAPSDMQAIPEPGVTWSGIAACGAAMASYRRRSH